MHALRLNIVMKLTTILIGLLCMSWVNADVLRVPQDYPSIQNAIDDASDGDTVLVAPGFYAENIRFLGKAIAIISEDGPEVTIIEGQQPLLTVIQFDLSEGPSSILSGFTVRNGPIQPSQDIYVGFSSPTIKGNIIDGNNAANGSSGAGIFINGGSPLIEGNIFRNHVCDTQSLSAVLTAVNESSPRITNNLFENNNCRAIRFFLPIWATNPEVLNNTIVGNTVGIRLNLIDIGSEQHIFVNNIITGNAIGLTVDSLVEGYNLTWEHNLAYDNLANYEGIDDQTGINGNITSDPLFIDQQNGDYDLGSGSPAIDAGTNTTAVLPQFDISGNARVIDGNGDGLAIVDIGAYEAQPAIIYIDIDILPKTDENTLNLNNRGSIQVAILSTSDFLAYNEVNPDSVAFGPAGAVATRYKIKDVNRDGLLDILFYFMIRETGIVCGDTEATLSGETFDRQAIEGTDSIVTKGCGQKRHN